MSEPFFILVRPQLGENIGAAARAMRNFGLARMRLVAPRDGWPNPKAVAAASGAGRLLEDARLFPDTGEAVADLGHLYATTARPRGFTKRVLEPQEAMGEAAARIEAGERVGFLFGPERTGLENDDVIRANTVVTVPVSPDFPSLNLAQCALILAYEWRRAAGGEAHAPIPDAEPATQGEVERLVAHLVEDLDPTNFFRPPEKRASMVQNLENLFRRAPLTEQDVRTLHGVIRFLSEKPRKPRG